MGKIQLLSETSHDIIKMKRETKILVTIVFLLMGILPSMSQRHMDFLGVPIHGKLDKLEQILKKEGWNIRFDRHNDYSVCAPIEREPDFIPASSSLFVYSSSKSSKITGMELWIRDEKRDSIYEDYKARFKERYGFPESISYSNYTYFLCKNKRGKYIGCILLSKKDNKMDMVIYVIDFKNHLKASREDGDYLEYFYNHFTSNLFKGTNSPLLHTFTKSQVPIR